MKAWTAHDIPTQRGRLAIITGATGGLGFETALELAGAGAQVVLTGRDASKGVIALEKIRAVHPAAVVRYETLDLASLASVNAFAARFKRVYGALDLLINNGGVMAPPTRQLTIDGFELQLATNYLSHFALTAALLPRLLQGKQPRVVNLSSIAHRYGASIYFDDLNGQHGYRPFAAYGQSKLAMLVFTLELQRRSDQQGWGLLSVAAHPGLAATALFQNGQRLGADTNPHPRSSFSQWMTGLLAQSASAGARSTLYAATAPEVNKAGYYGPTGFLELNGAVGTAKVARRARDQAVARNLWAVSEAMTATRWAPLLSPSVMGASPLLRMGT
jgi:NAD(P)-dependent dehydrogenase (short-subunit alcohol dehydrogenase family)